MKAMGIFVILIAVSLVAIGYYYMEELPEFKIQKTIVYYTPEISNPEYQQYIAKHFDVVDCGKTVSEYAQVIKSLNPKIKIIGYRSVLQMPDYYEDWDFVNQQEDWFIHDAYGNSEPHRMKTDIWGNYTNCYMKPNSGWKNYIIAQDITWLEENPHYSGLFLDNTLEDLFYGSGEGIYSDYYGPLQEGNVEPLLTWKEDTLALLSQYKSDIPLLMPNCWKWSSISNVTHGHCWEHFIHGMLSQHGLYDPGYNEPYSLQAIETLKDQAEKGITTMVICGTEVPNDNPTTEEWEKIREWQVFTLACFLFTVNDFDKAWYMWHIDKPNQGTYAGPPEEFYFPEMDYNWGKPMGEYLNLEGSLYGRDFDNYKVYANLSPDNSYSVSHGGINYLIQPRNGLFLRR